MWNRILSIMLALAIMSALGMLAYTVATASKWEKFTEFYMLGAEGKATDYPIQLEPGGKASLILGIINREQETISYQIKIEIDGTTASILEPIVLADGEKFEQVVSFTPDEPGDGQKVEFLLLKEGQNEAYRSLHLLVDVGKKERLIKDMPLPQR